jgi:hypothetical protein
VIGLPIAIVSKPGQYPAAGGIFLPLIDRLRLYHTRPFLVRFESAEMVYLFDFMQMRRREPDRFARDLL